MDFIVGLPRSQKGNDSIQVIVDRLTKIAHFVPVKTKTNAEKLADLYVEHILRLHGAPSSIVSDRGPQFMSRFWEACTSPLEPNLISVPLITHRQMDRLNERIRSQKTCFALVY